MVAAHQPAPTPAFMPQGIPAPQPQPQDSQPSSQEWGQVTNRLLDMLQGRTGIVPSPHQVAQSPIPAHIADNQYSQVGIPIPQGFQQISPSLQSYGVSSNSNRQATANALGVSANQAAEYVGWLENVVRSQQQTLLIADQIAQAFTQQQQLFGIADQIVQLFQQQQQQITIAEQIIGQFSQVLQALQQQEQTLSVADQALNALGPLATNAVVLGEFSQAQDLMIQKFWEILTDPAQCADWYLQLDPPPQQRQLVAPSAPVPSAFSRPSFPAPPPPGGVAGGNRDKLRNAWSSNPGMAWQVVDQLGSQDIAVLFGQ